MLQVYFDASALIKRYAPEPGTALLNEVFHRVPFEKMACSMLGVLEVISILVRKRNDGRLSVPLFQQALLDFDREVMANSHFPKTSVNNGLLIASTTLIQKHNLNSADTVILRSALDLQQKLRPTHEELLLWTSDKRLTRAATTEGLRVLNPETEPLATVQSLFPNTIT